jgi:hypothetical protein
MARPRDLIPGNCYFFLNYFDSDLVIPFVQTVIFEGTDNDENGETMWLFREPIAPATEADSPAGEEESPRVAFFSHSLYQILDLNGLIRELGGLTDFHPLRGITADVPSATPRTECPELAPVIDQLLTSPPGTSVTITIAFTDDGFSLQRRPGTVRFSHYLKSKTEQVQESFIRRLFDEHGWTPLDDYLANGGKTRVLSFVASDRDNSLEVASLATRILCEAYSMRADDTLCVHFQNRNNGPH